MIKFKVVELYTLLKELPIGHSRNTLSAQDCVVIEQISPLVTKIKACEAGRVYIKHSIVHPTQYGGQAGQQYLAESSHLLSTIDLFKKAKVSNVTISQRATGGLLITSYKEKEGRQVQVGRRLVNSYPGSVVDYQDSFPHQQKEVLLFKVEADKLWQLVYTNNCYSNYLNDRLPPPGSYSRVISLDLTPDRLSIISNTLSLVYAWSYVECNSNTTKSMAVEGRNLSYLQFLKGDCEVFHCQSKGREWLSFRDSSDTVIDILLVGGRVTLTAGTLQQKFGSLQCTRAFESASWKSAVIIATGEKIEKNVLLIENPQTSAIELRQAEAINRDDELGTCEFLLISKGVWEPIILTSTFVNLVNDAKVTSGNISFNIYKQLTGGKVISTELSSGCVSSFLITKAINTEVESDD
jgi:hypothetical protein